MVRRFDFAGVVRAMLVVAAVVYSRGMERCGALAGDAPRPNVLFLAVDDLRPEMDCYGVRQLVTPHFDRLADRGVRFDRAYCNIAVCGASRASLMKGLRPTPTRFTSYLTRADKDAPQVPSLPMVFKQHGYHTQSNGKVYHHVTDDPEAWSEPSWRPETSSIWWALPENRALSTGQRRGPAYEAADAPDELYPDHQICDKTLADLRRLAGQDKPFFLACGFYRPHLPFVAPQKYWDLYPTDQIRLPDNMFFPHDLPAAFQYTWGEMRSYHGIPKQGPVSEDTARQLIRGYYASVSFVDTQIGRLLDALDEAGVADNTIIVLWGDHGWQLGEHGFWCKHTNFEVASRAPLLIVAPEGLLKKGTDTATNGGSAGGQVQAVAEPVAVFSSRLVEFIDIYPTLCDLAGLPQPEHLQGKSMKPLLLDADAEHKEAVFTRHGGGDAVRTDRYRYKEMRSQGGRGELLGVGLFDLKSDPQENRNVAEVPAYAETRRTLQAMLDGVRAGFGSKP
jgi:iduronate 2-sulfatase